MDKPQIQHLLCGTCYFIIHLGVPRFRPQQVRLDVYCCRCGDRVLTPVFYWSDWDRFPCDGEHPYNAVVEYSGYTTLPN